jgi:hypothetical protein
MIDFNTAVILFFLIDSQHSRDYNISKKETIDVILILTGLFNSVISVKSLKPEEHSFAEETKFHSIPLQI